MTCKCVCVSTCKTKEIKQMKYLTMQKQQQQNQPIESPLDGKRKREKISVQRVISTNKIENKCKDSKVVCFFKVSIAVIEKLRP